MSGKVSLDESFIYLSAPVRTRHDLSAVSPGSASTCGTRLVDGRVVCWGWSIDCVLGVCPEIASFSPVPIVAPR